MNFSLLSLFLTLVFLVPYAASFSQDVKIHKSYEPHPGQEGKDVIWVPSPDTQVESMLDLAEVTSNDFVIDLGSGDGRTVIAAARRGAKSRGIEFEPNLTELSRKYAERAGLTDKTEFINGDLFKADLSQATVITLFLLPKINLKLRPSLLELKPGTRIVSNTFHMDEWIPDSTVRAEDCQFWCDAYLWIIPAKVDGTWKMNNEEMKLDQKFQKITGTIKKGKRTRKISAGRLNGNQIYFSVKKEKYSGHVRGNNIEGIVVSGRNGGKWKAVRTGN